MGRTVQFYFCSVIADSSCKGNILTFTSVLGIDLFSFIQSVIHFQKQFPPRQNRILLILLADLPSDLIVRLGSIIHIKETVNVVILQLVFFSLRTFDTLVYLSGLVYSILKDEVINQSQFDGRFLIFVLESYCQEEVSVSLFELTDTDCRFTLICKFMNTT